MGVVAIAFLLCQMFIKSGNKPPSGEGKKPESAGENMERKGKQVCLIAMMGGLFFIYVGTVVTFGMFLTTFVVKSQLGLTR